MNLRDLEYIVAVSELTSFSRAAKSCCVSQPSLSTQVKKLEEEIGIDIFSRGRRKVALTPAGERVVQIAKQILELQGQIENVGKEGSQALRGKVRLGAILTLAPYLFSPLMSYARKQEPELNLVLKEAKTNELLADLIDGNIDAAIVSLPTDPNVFESHFLFDDRFFLAVAADHPLAGAKELREDAIQGERLILLEEGHCFRDQALAVCSNFYAKEDSNFHATSFETIRHLVAVGEGVTLLPEIARRENDGLSYIPVPAEGYSREVGIIWRKNSKQKELLGKLKEMVVAALEVKS